MLDEGLLDGSPAAAFAIHAEPRWPWRLSVLAATAWVATAGCTPVAPVSSRPAADLSVSSPTVSAPAATATPVAMAATPSAVVIDAAEQYFYPEQVTVPAGTTVLWRDVQGTHDMVADDHSFASAVLFEGGTYSFTFTRPGNYRYVCTLHLGAGMWAEVVVE
jgi:plastocyanin